MAHVAMAQPAVNSVGLWRTAQAAGLLLTVVLLAALVTVPGLALNILWNAVVPVLPAVFLISPAIWRNVCPLATLTLLPGDRLGRKTITQGTVRATLVVGILLLLMLVPARRFLFNTDGSALAITVAAVAALSLGAGFLFKRKAGFCNAICPVLPVERLYGQRPLVSVRNVRCLPCIGCTERGCIDLSPADSIRAAVGPSWSGDAWVLSPFGAFAAAFPGFIVGYYTLANGPVSQAAGTYRHVTIAMAASFVIILVLVRALHVSAVRAMPGLAALSIGLYYWYAARVVTDAWHVTGGITWGIRGAALALIVGWLFRAAPAENAPT